METIVIIAADLVAISLLTFGIYFPRHHRRDLVTAFPGRQHRRARRIAGLTWLNLVSSCGGLYGADDGSGVVVEWGGGVQDVVAGLDGDAAVAP
jgi:hypothetical protein